MTRMGTPMVGSSPALSHLRNSLSQVWPMSISILVFSVEALDFFLG